MNFQIKNFIETQFSDLLIDLHNNFDFSNFFYDVDNHSLLLSWKKTVGDRVFEGGPSSLVFAHKNVNYLSVIPRDKEVPTSEDSCLEDITYFSKTNRENHGFLLDQSVPEQDDDIIFIFQGGQKIRVNCDEIELIVT